MLFRKNSDYYDNSHGKNFAKRKKFYPNFREIKSFSHQKSLGHFSKEIEPNIEKINKSLDFDLNILSKENNRLSIEVKALEKNLQENSCWAKGLSENIYQLKEENLMLTTFFNSILPIVKNSQSPSFFEIFKTFTQEQQELVFSLKNLINQSREEKEKPNENDKNLTKTQKLSILIEKKAKNKVFYVDQGVQKNDETCERLMRNNQELTKKLSFTEQHLAKEKWSINLQKEQFQKKIAEMDLKAKYFAAKSQYKQQPQPLKHSNLKDNHLDIVSKENCIKNLHETIEIKDTEITKWKERYMNLERKYQDLFKSLGSKQRISASTASRISLQPISSQNSKEISLLKEKLDVQEQNLIVNKLKRIEERASMQKIIKGLKDEIIEKRTSSILQEMNKEISLFKNI